MDDNMNYFFRTFIFLAFIVSKTYETSVSTRIWNPEVLPVVGENITLACIYTPPSTSRLLSWRNVDVIILAIDRCQGVGCRNEQTVPDVSKYSLRADSFSGNLTIRDLTVDDSRIYQCLVGTFSDAASDGIDLKVMLSGNMFPLHHIILGISSIKCGLMIIGLDMCHCSKGDIFPNNRSNFIRD